ncbi:MAG: N-glycosylase/DNA lyase [Candidatus Nanoarchaeia archaeon]|nr:N-glycosylase/DNA lyase [Candidatus Nanoarchaeia archaeon]
MQDLHGEYSKRKSAIKARLKDFEKAGKSDIFYELCFCICTPQSSAKKSDSAIKSLIGADFKNNKLEPSTHLVKAGVRFHKNKGEYMKEFKKNYQKHSDAIKTIKNPFELREYLVKNVKGYGLKEASHALRNIGYKNLAILDRHIMKNLLKLKVIEELPKTLTPKRYYEIENKFLDYSKKIKIPIDELDLLFWSEETGEIFK